MSLLLRATVELQAFVSLKLMLWTTCDCVDLVRGETLLEFVADMASCFPPLEHPLDDIALVW